MNVPALKSEAQVYNLLRQRVLDQYPALDDETIRDTLEGITTLHELISEVIRSALFDEALQIGLRTRLEEMRQRLVRFEERGTKKRQLALETMCEVGLKKLEQPDFTASARSGVPSLIIVSEELVPAGLLGAPTPEARSPGASRRSEARRRNPRRATRQPPTNSCSEDKVMAFTEAQLKSLEAKLDAKYVRTRRAHDTTLAYVEGWHVIAEANRIFGYDAWDRHTLSTRCVWSGEANHHFAAAYTAKVRIAVRAGSLTITREGCGSGEAKAATPGEAHELALKAAETDATKRALATFGNPFGLALYDRELAGVKNRKALVPGCEMTIGARGCSASLMEPAKVSTSRMNLSSR